jgi:tRNA (guanine-N7-)-methyltransferase
LRSGAGYTTVLLAGAMRPPSWREIFGDDRPVEVEIGPGHGDTLLAFAAARSGTNFFAIEHHSGAAEAIMARARAGGLGNVRVVAADARCVVAHLVADRSVAAYHVYFPDPWPKTRHRRRRLANETLARHLVRTLIPGGAVHLASDLPAVVAELAALLADAGLARVSGAAPPPDRPVTAFERKYARSGTYYARLKSEGLRLPDDADG